MRQLQGTGETRDFYDADGWQVDRSGQTMDAALFGVREDGPLREGIFHRKWSRIQGFIGPTSPESSVVEVGCGGSPERHIISAFANYTGVDFSKKGLLVAREKTAAAWPHAVFVQSDAVALPFDDASFDCVYSAHMIYHIADPAAQEQALAEMLRVLRPGGTLVIQSANPRPLLFPFRLAMRVVAEVPALGRLARKVKGPSPIPYNPQRIGWIRSRLAKGGAVTVIGGSIASTAFNQNVTEYRGVGRLLWRIFDRIDKRFPSTAAWLGNYVVFLVHKAD